MDFPYIAKLAGSLASALAAWWGFRKFRTLLTAYREALGPQKAQPFVSLRYRWSGELPAPQTHVLILHLGNQEGRPIIIHKLIWSVPRFRLTWPAETRDQAFHPRIETGGGIELEFNPDLALSLI